MAEVAAQFGPDVAELVAEMTENPKIQRYPARKAEARSRVLRDRRAAAIYAADKLANTRELLAAQKDVPGETLDHYIKTLRFLSKDASLSIRRAPGSSLSDRALPGAGRAGRAGGKLGP